MGSGDEQRIDPAPYLAALPALRAARVRLKRKAGLLAALVTAVLFALGTSLAWYTGAYDPATFGLAVLVACQIAWWSFTWLASKPLRSGSLMRAHLRHSGLAQRLTTGQIRNEMEQATAKGRRRPRSRHHPIQQLTELLFVAQDIDRFIYLPSPSKEPDAAPTTGRTSPGCILWLILGAAVLAAIVVLAFFGDAFSRREASSWLIAVLVVFAWPMFQLVRANNIKVLDEYLSASLPAVEPDDLLPQSTIQLNLLLSDMERQLAAQQQRSAIFVAIVLGVAAFFFTLVLFDQVSPLHAASSALPLLVAAGVGVTVFSFVVFLETSVFARAKRRYAAHISTLLSESDIAIRIVNGQVDVLSPPSCVLGLPPLWQNSRYPPGDMKDELRRGIWEAAANLGHYLGSTRRPSLLGECWPCLIVPFGLAAVLVSLAVLDSAGLAYLAWAMVGMAFGTALIVLVVALMERRDMQRRVWTEELIAHLRERLVGDPPAFRM